MKKWYHSKSLILNILAVIAAVVQALQGQPWLNVELQVAILAVLNALVRLVTNTTISGTPSAKVK